jgi:GNAT superfamily N-acetyltransferase
VTDLHEILWIEEAAFNAWPDLQRIYYDGWLLRFSQGYTKRANSVNPLGPGALPVEQKIDFCEQLYRQEGLPPIFRLTPLTPAELDPALAGRGYQKIHLTRVMRLPLQHWQMPAGVEASCRELALEPWLGVHAQVSRSLLARQPGHAEILRGILPPRLTAALEISGQWLACGMGVLERGLFGLFEIVTHPDFRNQGHATRLIGGMLAWAQARGAKWSYLQVLAENAPARRLYEKLGFVDFYEYWYRVPPDF